VASFLEAQHNYTQAAAKYEELKPQHDIHCHTFLMHRLQDPTLLDAHHQAITKHMATKKNWDSFCHIHQLQGDKKGSSITQVKISSELGPQLILGKANIKQAICQSLQQQFTKAPGYPFLHGKILSHVSLLGCSTTAKEILEGTYQCPLDVDTYTQQFIEALQWLVVQPEMILAILSPENFCTHWCWAREST